MAGRATGNPCGDWDSVPCPIPRSGHWTSVLDTVGHAGAVPLAEAIEAAKAQPLAAHGEIGNGRAEGGRSSDRTSTRGETRSYLLRRIARDQPELLDQIGSDKPYAYHRLFDSFIKQAKEETMLAWFVIITSVASASMCKLIAESKGLKAQQWGFAGLLLGPLAVLGAAGMADKRLQKALIRDSQDVESSVNPATLD